MFDAQRLLGSLLGSSRSSSLTRRLSRSLGVPTHTLGALTLLGKAASTALERFSQPRSTPDAATSMPTPTQPDDGNHLALTLIRAMIAAAKADGEIDPAERRRIVEQLPETSSEERAFLEAEMAKPLDLTELLAEVKGQMMAAEVYTASLLAIRLDTPAEAEYLKNLAHGLNLSADTVNKIHDQAGAIRIFN